MEDACRVGQPQPTKPSTMPILETLPDVTPVIDEDGFQEVRGRHRKEGLDSAAPVNEGFHEATVVLTSNGFEVLGVNDSDIVPVCAVDQNNHVLGALPHLGNV